MNLKPLLAALGLAALSVGPAAAHMVTFGWQDLNNGTIRLWAEHWHGYQDFPCTEGINCSDNGGLTISGDGVPSYTVQWGATANGVDRDDLVADGTLVGYADVPGNAGGGDYDNWLITAPLVLGDGTWTFFTGINCCIDTMGAPVELTLEGIGSVDPGTGPGSPSPVPLPAALPILLSGLGALGFAAKRRRRA